jgi:transposase-like protein
MEKEPKPSLEIIKDADGDSAVEISISKSYFDEANLAYFGQIINSYSEGNELENPINSEKLLELLDIYLDTSSKGDENTKVESVIHLLQGETTTDPFKLEDTVEAVLEVAQVIAQNMNKPQPLSRESTLFSLGRTEELRIQINNYAGVQLFNAPFLDEEIWALVGVYARTHFKQYKVPVQTDKIVAVLQGKKIKDIAEEFGVKQSTISEMWRKALSNIAQEFLKEMHRPEMQNLLTVDQSVQIFLHETGLSKSHSLGLKKHLGGLESPISTEEVIINVEVGGRIQEEIKQRVDYAKFMGEEGLPSDESLRIISVLLGSKRNGVFPISRKNLVQRYYEDIKHEHSEVTLSDEVINEKIYEYNYLIDSSLRDVALWMDSRSSKQEK